MPSLIKSCHTESNVLLFEESFALEYGKYLMKIIYIFKILFSIICGCVFVKRKTAVTSFLPV